MRPPLGLVPQHASQPCVGRGKVPRVVQCLGILLLDLVVVGIRFRQLLPQLQHLVNLSRLLQIVGPLLGPALGAEQMVRLMDMLEDNDDVQKVYTNADIPEEVLNGL